MAHDRVEQHHPDHPTNSSLWRATAPMPTYSAFSGEVFADVVIVGAGITGVTAAALLSRAGKRVIIVDRRTVGSGVTSGTTAHITAVLDSRFHKIAADFGTQNARLAAESHMQAIRQIGMIASTYGIACEFKRVPGYLYTEKAADRAMIEQEFSAMKEAGLQVSLTTNPGLPFAVHLAIRVEDQAQFHPLKYLYGLARSISAGGNVRIFEQTRVEEIEDDDDGVNITTMTQNGSKGTIHAGAVLMATHIPPGLNIVDTQAAPYRSYVIACKSAGQYPEGLFWDTETPYNYTRTYEQDGTKWLIIGGKDHKTGQSDDTEAHYRAVEQYARERFTIESIEYRWSAQVYEPVDGLGYIGKSPGANRYYYAAGYAGNGMTYSNVAARLVSDMILGRDNPYADLYSPSRIKPLAGAVDYVKENVNVVAHLVVDRLQSDGSSLAEVEQGEGKIVRIDGQQIAAYRDEHGTMHTLSPVCPHMSCIVDWNEAERTWDCPCHGGRFEATGKWIEGPPMHDLKRVDVEAKAK